MNEQELDSKEDGYFTIAKESIEGYHRAATIIKHSSRLMHLMNEGMLNSSLLKEKKLKIEDECVKDFHTILTSFTELFSALLEKKKIKLTLAKDF